MDPEELGPANRATSEHEDAILTRMARRIRGARGRPSLKREQGEYFVSDAEAFWDRHLADLVNDAFGLGVARSEGLAPFGELMGKAFGTTQFLLAGYIQLGGHVNNLARGPCTKFESSRASFTASRRDSPNATSPAISSSFGDAEPTSPQVAPHAEAERG